MRSGLILVYILLFFSMILTSAWAVTFTATSDPTGANAGQSNQLINFSISNTGSVNITQLNITLPNGFTFTGSSGTTTTSPYTASSSPPSWTNTSSIGIVGNGATQYFWIYVSTPSATGSYSFNISTLDANAAFSSNNVIFSNFDTLGPTYSSNTTSPNSNSTYAINQSYWFNITWTDGSSVSKVFIEHNLTGSGTPHNETMTNDSSVFYLNLTDLSAGTYVWRVYANDTNNTFNSTPQFTYLISQATNGLSIYLNGTLNSNITSINNTAINITVNATCTQPACTITIIRDGGTTIISGGSNPYSTNNIITTVGLHNYTVSVTSNINYTSNSATYFVATAPSSTTSTFNMPLTFSNTTVGSINITFDSDANLANVQIQGDWSGTATNYTMSNFSLSRYFYNITFPAGTSTWKIFGTYSGHTFNLTFPNSLTINQATPTLTLNITPQWALDTPIQTNVTCKIDTAGLTATLYRNGTVVTQPDVQTFSAGSIYEYLCNSTTNKNYTSNAVKNALVIKPKISTTLSFVQAPAMIEIVQNSTITSEIKVKNAGNVGQNVTLDVSGVDKSWYSIDRSSINVLVGGNGTFILTFTVGNADIKDYSGKFTANSSNATISQDFTLRVLPSNETKLKINDTLSLYKLDVNKLESRLGELKSKINDTGTIETKLNELKSAVNNAEGYINSSNYFQAQQTFDTIKALISEVEYQLSATKQPGVKVTIPSIVWLLIGGVIIVSIVVIIAYMFWPAKKGYKPEKGYTFTGEKSESPGIVKSFLSRFKRKKKIESVLES